MDYIIVTGRVSGKEFLVPVDNISTVEAAEYGADIYLKREGNSPKVKKIECKETLKEIKLDLGALQ